MQLKDIKISNSIKNSIDNKVFNKKIPNLIKFKIQKMILEDKLFVAIKNSTN
jgi:ribosomal protein L31E